MIAVSSAPQHIANSGVLAWTITLPVSDSTKTGSAELVFPGFDYSFSTTFELNFSPNFHRSNLRIKLDEGVTLECDFQGKPTNGNQKISYEGKAQIKIVSDRPSAHFIANTTELLLILDRNARLNIPSLQLSIDITATEPLAAVGAYLQRRQTTYRLMCVEKAFNQSFSVPQRISDSDRKDIAFVYYAVADRFFSWPFGQEDFPCLATDEAQRWLGTLDGTKSTEIAVDCYECLVLGERFILGKALINIEEALVANPKEVSPELKTLDGHPFQVSIRSLTGKASYRFFDAPCFEVHCWDKSIAGLINLENQLDERFFDAGNNLAANTFAGLTEKEKGDITEPFVLGGVAFEDSDLSGED